MYKPLIFITGIVGITIIIVVAIATGHDNAIVTGGVSAIVGICTGVGLYYKGKSVQRKADNNREGEHEKA